MQTDERQVGRLLVHPDRHLRDRLQDVVDRLCVEYGTDVTAGSVIRCVARCTAAAVRSEVPRSTLPETVERMARAALDGRVGPTVAAPVVDLVDLRGRASQARRA